jgi:ABC-type molybdenum transport system ATPase subunit/photorepair protein PhrA
VIKHTIPREPLVERIRRLITPAEEARPYPFIIGDHGTGKTSLIKLAVNGMDENEPKGVVYVDIPLRCDLEVNVAQAMREALGWGPDQVIDSSKRKYSSSFQ